METLKIKNKNCEVEVLNNNLKSLNVTKNDIEYKLIAFDPNNYVISFIMAPWVNRIEDGKFECEKGVFNLLDNHKGKIFIYWHDNDANINYQNRRDNLLKYSEKAEVNICGTMIVEKYLQILNINYKKLVF